MKATVARLTPIANTVHIDHDWELNVDGRQLQLGLRGYGARSLEGRRHQSVRRTLLSKGDAAVSENKTSWRPYFRTVMIIKACTPELASVGVFGYSGTSISPLNEEETTLTAWRIQGESGIYCTGSCPLHSLELGDRSMSRGNLKWGLFIVKIQSHSLSQPCLDRLILAYWVVLANR